MKPLFVCLILILAGARAQAQDLGLYWKYKEYDGAIAVTAPHWLIHAGSWFLDQKEDRKIVRKVRKVRVLTFENSDNPISGRDMERFYKKAKRRKLEELLMVRSQGTRVWVLAKERRGSIRKVVVLVDEPDTFVLVSLRGKLRYEEIGQLLDRLSKQQKGKGQPEVPLLPENVRTVIRL
jgi:hypothetical protein